MAKVRRAESDAAIEQAEHEAPPKGFLKGGPGARSCYFAAKQ